MAGSDQDYLAFQHAIRLINVIRNPKEGDLLAQLLDAAPVNIENVTKLFLFARWRWGGDNIGGIFPKIDEVCTEYLRANNAPIPPRTPRCGEPGFKSCLEEFND